MLLGTYQPAFMAGCNEYLLDAVWDLASGNGLDGMTKEEYGSFWNKKTELAEECVDALGIDPVWCFPCRDPKDAFVQSSLSSPNATDLFFLIDADDYVKIDRVRWEGHIKDGTATVDALRECVAPDLDDGMCDFLIDRSRLSSFGMACMPVYAFAALYVDTEFPALEFFRRDGGLAFTLEKLETRMPGITEMFRKAGLELSRVERGTLVVPENSGMDSDVREYMLDARWAKVLFECSMLPGLVGLCLSGFKGFEVADFFRTVVTLDRIRAAQLAFVRWVDSFRTQAGYMAVMEAFGDCWCEEKAVLHRWFSGSPWPGRNKACVCGSGRKFKMCCGRKYGLI